MFGQLKLEIMPIKTNSAPRPRYSDGMPDTAQSTTFVEVAGLFLIGIYHVIIIIVLVNMLIAMMSHSFEKIQVHPSRILPRSSSC